MKPLITCVLLGIATVALAQKQQGVAADTARFNIGNCVSTYSPEKGSPTAAGHQFWFVDKTFLDGRTLKMSVVAPHKATHPPHKHVEDEFFFVLEGKAEFFLDGKTTVVGPYTSLYCPSMVEHGIRNVGDTELKYLVIKKYADPVDGQAIK